MNGQIEKLNERLDFYMKAYQKTSDDLKACESEKIEIEQVIETEAHSIISEAVPNPLGNNQIAVLEKEYQINLDDIVAKHEALKSSYLREKESLRSDSRYKEYLNLLINDDLKLASKMESDEVFGYLIDQGFGTDDFKNEPYIEIWKLKYQPRFWKFKKIADKKAKEFGLASFTEMDKLWSGLRINYQSLIGNKKITDVIRECEEIENRIKNLDVAIADYLVPRTNDIVNEIIERIKLTDSAVLNKPEFTNLIPLLEKYKTIQEQTANFQDRNNVIMSNISAVEKMITLAEEGRLELDEKSSDSFFHNTNPATPIFELVSNDEWDNIKKALEDKGIRTSSKENYSVVRKKVTKKEKEEILNKYNVKEGEIFIDQTLANKN